MPKYLDLSGVLESRILDGSWKKGKFPSVREIAEEHRVSILTASRAIQVLQGKGLIQTVERSGSSLNHAAFSARDRWGVCLRVTPGAWQNASASVVQTGLDAITRRGDCSFVPLNLDLAASESSLRRSLDETQESGVRGIFFLPSRLNDELAAQDERFLALCRTHKFSVILLDRNLRGYDRPLEYDLVASDHFLGGQLSTDHLLSLGRSRIACVVGSPTSAHIDREAGYLFALSAASRRLGTQLAPLVIELPATSGRESLGTLTDRILENQVDGVLCFQDYTAVGLILELFRRGVRVPQDVAVVGCDDLPIGNTFSIGVTTFAYPAVEIMRTAVDRMRVRVQNPELLPVKICIPSRLIVRDSTIAEMQP
jgi:LacI family transcriptional regulator